jgi:signal transduction histidine kinase
MGVPTGIASPSVRSAPPPREVTAAALVHGLASAQRLIGPASLVLALTLLIEVEIRAGDATSLAALVLWWMPAFAVSVVLAARPTAMWATATVVVGLIAGTGFVATILQVLTVEQTRGLFLVEALAWALMFIGAVRPRATSGMLWVFIGFSAGTVSLFAGHLIAGREVELSPDRLIDAVIMVVAYAVISIGGRRGRGRLPELPSAEIASRRQAAARQRERAAAALVHDTVLGSLTLLEREGIVLDDRIRQGIRRDLDAVASARATSVGVVSAAPVEGSFAARVLSIIDDLRWKGLRVDLSGAGVVVDEHRIPEPAREAILAAMAAALENVRLHAGTDRAEVTIGTTDRALTVLIVDAGAGFDEHTVPADRLGVRESIRGRLQRVGGVARIWSNASGTTVMLSVPFRGSKGSA